MFSILAHTYLFSCLIFSFPHFLKFFFQASEVFSLPQPNMLVSLSLDFTCSIAVEYQFASLGHSPKLLCCVCKTICISISLRWWCPRFVKLLLSYSQFLHASDILVAFRHYFVPIGIHWYVTAHAEIALIHLPSKGWVSMSPAQQTIRYHNDGHLGHGSHIAACHPRPDECLHRDEFSL